MSGRRATRTLLPIAVGVGALALAGVAIALDLGVSAVAGWLTSAVFAGIALAAEHGPLAQAIRRSNARRLHGLAALTIVNLYAQGEQRPEVMDQTGWIADSLESRQELLKAVGDGVRVLSGPEFDQLYRRTMVDVEPALSEIAAEHPNWYTRFVTWLARRDARSGV